jgi:lysozyme
VYDLIKRYEGFRPDAYPDPATGGEPWTIGYGTTAYPDGRKVRKGDVCPSEEAEAYLKNYIETEITPRIANLNLKDSQLEAVVSLCYNVGTPLFLKSKLCTAIRAYARSASASDLAEICRQWDFWLAAGRPMKGLVKRRVEELGMFVGGV